MKDTIFREYDIRGKVGEELVIDQVYDLARAIAYYFKQQNSSLKTIAVGMDGRTHSDAIKTELCRALMDSGLDVIFIGVCPSPVLYFALYMHPVDAGLMITASHNPKEYNGIKIALGIDSVWGTQIKQINQLYREKKYINTDTRGTYTPYSLVPIYVEWLVDHFKHLKNITLPIVFDCANAVGGTVIPLLIEKMGWQNTTQVLYAQLDGTFPNHEADPVVIENMLDVKKVLQETDAQVGIGFDGDADRMCAMTKQGRLVAGDILLAIFAQSMIHQYPHMAVVFNVTTSAGLVELLEKWDAKPYMVPTGHAIIKEKMHESGALLGGEVSCHFFFNDRYFGYDDGIYAALRLIEIMYMTDKSLQELIAIFPKKEVSREYRLVCAEEEKKTIVEAVTTHFSQRSNVHLITIDGVRVTMPYGWGIIRAANTQPVISARFESDTKEGLEQVKKDFIEILQKYLSPEILVKLKT